MKNVCTYLLVCLFWIPYFVQAQTALFCGSAENLPCAFDSTQTVFLPPCFTVYQTLDGSLDGPIDSTKCFSGDPDLSSFRLPLNQFDLDLPIFVAMKTTNVDIFPPNSYVQFEQSIGTTDSSLWLVGQNCADGICSGSFLKIRIPDSLGQPGNATRLHKFSATEPRFISHVCPFGSVRACLATEYFEGQYVEEVITKITIDPSTVRPMSALSVNAPFVQVSYSNFGFDMNTLTDVLVHPNHQTSDSTYLIYLEQAMNMGMGGWPDPVLAVFGDTTKWPSPDNIYHIEARPFDNTVEVKTIKLTVLEYQPLIFQPYVAIRGDYTADSLARHNFILENNGGDICISFVDLVSGGGSAYIHNGGQLNMNNPWSCMQFANGGLLKVGKNATLHYGNEGMGMLVLGEEAQVELEDGSRLVIDAFMSLTQKDYTKAPESVTMDLKPNTSLVFTKNAILTNEFSTDKAMKLNVNMLGGTLDDSALSVEERAIINRIYPEPRPVFAENWQILGNPSASVFEVKYLAAQDEACTLDIFDLQGRTLLHLEFEAEKGANLFSVEHRLPAGAYGVRFRSGMGEGSRVLIVVE